MEKIVEFVGNNYGWVLTILLILLFGIIGYVVDSKRNQNDLIKQKENELDENIIESLNIDENKTINDMINKDNAKVIEEKQTEIAQVSEENIEQQNKKSEKVS